MNSIPKTSFSKTVDAWLTYNLALTLSIVTFAAIKTLYPFEWQSEVPSYLMRTLNLLGATEFFLNMLVKWWIPAGGVYWVLCHGGLASKLPLNRLTHLSFVLANLAVFAYGAYLTAHHLATDGEIAYFARQPIQTVVVATLAAGLASLVGCIAWQYCVKDNDARIRQIRYWIEPC